MNIRAAHLLDCLNYFHTKMNKCPVYTRLFENLLKPITNT